MRQLYSDQDEVLFDAARSVILNGIEDIVTRPDLADRAVFLTLEPIPEERRRPEQELWAAFGLERPRLIRITTRPSSAPETGGTQPSASSAPPADWPKTSSGNGFASPDSRTVGNVVDGSTGQTGTTVRANPLISNAEPISTLSQMTTAMRSMPPNCFGDSMVPLRTEYV